MDVKEELLRGLEEGYTKANLQKGYVSSIQKIFSTTNPPALIASILEKKSKNKEDLLILVGSVLSKKEWFQALLSVIPEDARRLFENLVWEEEYLEEGLVEDRYGIKIVEERGTGYGRQREVMSEFFLFSVKERYDWRTGNVYYIGLPAGMRKTLKEYFDKPEGYYLKLVEAVPEDYLPFQGEEAIFQELQRILVYARQGNIRLTNSGIPVVSTFSKMRKTLSLKEFYDGEPKPYDALRTSLLATLISNYGIFPVAAEPLDALKDIFQYFRRSFYPLHLLNYLKGIAYVEDRNKNRVGEEMMKLLESFPEEEGWVSMENIRKYASFRSLPLEPASDYAMRNYVYMPVKDYDFTDKVSVGLNYQALVKIPLLKATFWLFAAFGLVDAAYAKPGPEDEDPFTTPYDFLGYVRLTPLGAYLTGRTKAYSAPASAGKTNIQLLDDSLHILSDKPDETVDLLLDNYTVKTGPSRYRTDFQIFMKGIRNGDELEAKISLFRQTVSDTVPPNWQNFFETLRRKCDPLKSIGEHQAYQLSQQDQELIGLVAKDPILKKLVIKAEGLIVLVMKKDLARFKSRLKEFGYLLE